MPRRQAGNASGMCVGIGGHGQGGAEGELEVPVRWLSEPGVGVCRVGGRALSYLHGVQPQCVSVCGGVILCLGFWSAVLGTLPVLPSLPRLPLHLPQEFRTLAVVLNLKAASQK